MPIRFDDLSSFDQINLGATLVQTAVVIAFAVAVAGVWLTHRRPAMQALTAYWVLFGGAAVVNVFSSWSGAVWRDRVLSLTLTAVVVALHAASAPLAAATVHRLEGRSNAHAAVRLSVITGIVIFAAHVGGVSIFLAGWPTERLGPVLWSRGLHAAVFLVPALSALAHWRGATRNRRSILLLAGGFTVIAARGVLEFILGFRVGMPDLSTSAVASAILFNILGLVALGAASLIAMAAEEEEIVRRQADELRRAEQSRQQGERLESLGRLAGGVAHDFNNLLAVVMTSAQNLKEDAPTPTQLEEIDGIAGAADRGRDLVKQLLTFARQQPASNDVFEVDAQLTSLRGMLDRLAGLAELQLTLDATSALVQMERSQFDQVVLNLVVNARDACGPSGRVALTTSLLDTPAEGVLSARGELTRAQATAGARSWICVAVTDTGAGIPAEVLPFIFDPFFSTKPADRGTGLGLSTVMGVVARAGGDIVVNSTTGQGTRIEVWLPRASRESLVANAAPA